LELRKEISTFLNTTIFLLPELDKRVKMAEYEIRNIKNEITYQQGIINQNTIYKLDNFKKDTLSEFYSREIYDKKNIYLGLKKFNLPIYLNSGKKARGYLANNKDDIYFIRADGNIYNISKDEQLTNQKSIIQRIDTNIKEKIFDLNFFDNNKSTKYGSFVGVKDLMIHKNKIYFSYLKENKNECYSIAILSANLSKNFLEFSEFFNTDECVQTDTRESGFGKGFGLLHSGGRMEIINDSKSNEEYVLFTTGELMNRPLAQNQNSIFGKIISINIRTRNYEIFSSGFRNSQGLLNFKKKSKIISTEHGPVGGDEINIIEKNGNYGWPISSYGEHYPEGYYDDKVSFSNEKIAFSELIKIAPLNKSHKDYGFVEPVYVFSPLAIAPSQIIEISKKFINSKNDLFFLTSLKAGSLFILEFNRDFSKAIFLEQIRLNERIRDIIYDSELNLYLLIFESSGSLGVLYNNDTPYKDCKQKLVNFEYRKNIDFLTKKMKNSFEDFCKNKFTSPNPISRKNIENIISDSMIKIIE